MVSYRTYTSFSGVFDHGLMEALSMRWLKREVWKVGIIITGMLLFLALMTWTPLQRFVPLL